MSTLTPHGACLLWKPELIWLNDSSNFSARFLIGPPFLHHLQQRAEKKSTITGSQS